MQAQEQQIDKLYDRIAADLKSGAPLVATVYVALCDNDSQGIMPVKNKRICKGDVPEENLYWAGSGGLKGHARTERWKKVLYEKSPSTNIAVRGVWKKRLPAGGALRKRGIKGSIDVVVVGLGYRGVRIRDAALDYFRAVTRDEGESLPLPDGTTIGIGGKSHVVGYVGHNYLMDEPDVPGFVRSAAGNGTLEKGVFGLACVSDEYFRVLVERENTHIMALNRDLTFPSAFTVLGIVRGVAAGQSLKGIHKEAARAFAKGQKQSVGTMLRALSWGRKERD